LAFGEAAQAVADLTLIFDPAEVWPDPDACPDWPLTPQQNAQGLGFVGLKAAGERLEHLQHVLGRSAPLAPPTDEEREALRRRYFVEYSADENNGQGRNVGPWSISLGLRGVSWRDHTTESTARMIVEALHVRGYLRKLDAMAERHKVVAEDHKRRGLQQTLDAYPNQSLLDEYASLAEAAARHQQRLDDEKAFHRRAEIKRNFTFGYSAVTAAARELGVQPPPLPEL